MYIKRDIASHIISGAKESPAISIIGPRQSGKSTLCKQIFPDHSYVDMQDLDNLQFALSDPKGFLQANTNNYGIVIDEAQYAPLLFQQIKVEIDKDRDKMGRYILSGSQNFLLSEKITESLAGRVYIYKLLPLSIHEISQVGLLEESFDKQIVKGFYPDLYKDHKSLDMFYESYFYTYVERDLRAMRNIENLSTFKRFLQLCIARIGQPLNITSLANESGISVLTARAWLSLLEASFILFLLPSYHNNLSKRVVKSPKLYFYDTGLATHIIGAGDNFKENRPLLGQLFENMVIVDLLKHSINSGLHSQFYFFRDVNLKEVDLMLDLKGTMLPVEIKSSKTIQSSFFDTLNWVSAELKLKNPGTLIYGGDKAERRSYAQVYSWRDGYKLFS